MEQSKSNYLECQKREETGEVPPSHRKIITPLAEYLRIEQKINEYFMKCCTGYISKLALTYGLETMFFSLLLQILTWF